MNKIKASLIAFALLIILSSFISGCNRTGNGSSISPGISSGISGQISNSAVSSESGYSAGSSVNSGSGAFSGESGIPDDSRISSLNSGNGSTAMSGSNTTSNVPTSGPVPGSSLPMLQEEFPSHYSISNNQQGPGWYFQSINSNNGSVNNLDFISNTLYFGTSEGVSLVKPFILSGDPDKDLYAAMTFKVPYDATAQILPATPDAAKISLLGTSPEVKGPTWVKITLNGNRIWPAGTDWAQIPAGGSVSFPTLNLSVIKGDTISFVSKGNEVNGDHNQTKIGPNIILHKKPITPKDLNYTYSWWANGIRDYNNSTRRMNIMTGSYGMSIDPYNLKIEKLGSFSTPISREKAQMTTANTMITSLPQHSLKLYAKVGSDIYESGTSDDGMNFGAYRYNYRTIEAGRISQRFDVINFSISKGGQVLNALGHLEVQAFSDYFSLIYELMPKSAISNVQMSFKWTLPPGYNNIKWMNNIVGSRAVCVTNSAGKGFTFVAPSLPEGIPDIKITGTEIIFTQSAMNFIAPSGTTKPKSEPYGNRKGFNIFIIPSNRATVSDADRFIEMETVSVTVTAQQKTTLQTTAPTNNKVTYIPGRGVYEISLNPTKPAYSVQKQREMLDRVIVKITNSTNSAKRVPVVLWRQDGFTEGSWLGVEQGSIPVMRSVTANGFGGQGIPTGDFVQLTKNYHTNWAGLGSVLYEGMWLRYTSYVNVPANSTVSYDYSIAYATWGGVNAVSHAQLSLCGWGYNDLWTQLSLGTNIEQIATNPETIQTDGMINDVHPLMVRGYSGMRWTLNDNVGGGGFLTYYTDRGQQFGKSVKTDFIKHGPNLSEVNYTWITADNAIEASVRMYMGRTDDMTRSYLKLRYKVLKDTTFTRLALFQMGIDKYDNQVDTGKAYGNELGAAATGLVANAPQNGYDPKIKNIAWTGPNRWIMSYGGPVAFDPSSAASNRLLVLREWRARINGNNDVQPTLSSHGTKRISTAFVPNSNWEITLPKGISTLKKGDYIEMLLEWDVIPQYKKDYYGPQTDLIARMLGSKENSWEAGLFISQKNKITVMANTGTLESTYPVIISTKNNAAQFTIKNGVGYCPVTFNGLTGNKGYILETKQAGGTYIPVNQSINGNDFWQCDYDADTRTYSITYNIFRDGKGTTDDYRLRQQ